MVGCVDCIGNSHFLCYSTTINRRTKIHNQRTFIYSWWTAIVYQGRIIFSNFRWNDCWENKGNSDICIGHVFNVSSAPRFYSSTGGYKFYTGMTELIGGFLINDICPNLPAEMSREVTAGDNISILFDRINLFRSGCFSKFPYGWNIRWRFNRWSNWIRGWRTSWNTSLVDILSKAIFTNWYWNLFSIDRWNFFFFLSEIGKLIGRYFDTNGAPTEHFHHILLAVNRMKKVNYSHQPLFVINHIIEM